MPRPSRQETHVAYMNYLALYEQLDELERQLSALQDARQAVLDQLDAYERDRPSPPDDDSEIEPQSA